MPGCWNIVTNITPSCLTACWNIGSNLQNKDICFSNNAANTNTQQSPPLAKFWLKQIKPNSYETEGYKKNTIPPRA
jgi:hypothetical protein